MESTSPQPQRAPAIDPYTPPRSDEHRADEASRALYSPGAIIASTILFTPLLGGIMAARNWRRLDDRRRATLSLVTGLVATVVLVVLGLVLPDSMDAGVRGGSIGLAVVMGMQWRRELSAPYESHLKNGGQKASPLIPILIALGVIAAFVAVAIFFGPDTHGPSM